MLARAGSPARAAISAIMAPLIMREVYHHAASAGAQTLRSPPYRNRRHAESANRPSARAGTQIVRMSGLQAGPLGNRAPISAVTVLPVRTLRPAGRRILPPFLPPIDREVEQRIAVAHPFDAAPRRPVRLEDPAFPLQVADDMHHAHVSPDQQRVERGARRGVPRHVPAHEVAVTRTLLPWALADCGVGDVARMKKGQFAHLRGVKGAALALFRRGAAGMPHEIIGDK